MALQQLSRPSQESIQGHQPNGSIQIASYETIKSRASEGCKSKFMPDLMTMKLAAEQRVRKHCCLELMRVIRDDHLFEVFLSHGISNSRSNDHDQEAEEDCGEKENEIAQPNGSQR
jgi:hypothetical protein